MVRRNWQPVTISLFLVALVAGFAPFGAVASLDKVAGYFGHHSTAKTLQSVVGLSGSQLGIGLAILRFASLGALPLASLADRWGRVSMMRRTLFVGLLVTAGAALSPSYWFFVACFALARPLLSSTSTLVQVVTVELSSTAARIDRLVIVSAGAGIGAGLAAIFAGLLRGPSSFRLLFALALVPIFFLRPLLRSIPEPVFRGAGNPLARIGAVPRDLRGRVTVVGLIVFVVGMISGPAGGFTFVYGEGVLKISSTFVALVVALSALTGLAGLLLSRYFAVAIGRRGTIILGTLATAGAACVAYGGGKAAFVIGYMAGVAAGGLLAPALSALSTELFPHTSRATAAGWIVVAGVVGAIVGLIIFGVVGDSVHVTGSGSLRLAAFVTFLPLLPLLGLLFRLPESSHMELS
jgi:AAHS family benzoate transporter-like MFS transporter